TATSDWSNFAVRLEVSSDLSCGPDCGLLRHPSAGPPAGPAKVHRNLPLRHRKTVGIRAKSRIMPATTEAEEAVRETPGNAMPHIEIRDVSLFYDTPAGRVHGVDKASFNIEQSEFLCIVGPSGCGKSTLLNIIAGFLEPTGGVISIGGKAVKGHGQDRGVVF